MQEQLLHDLRLLLLVSENELEKLFFHSGLRVVLHDQHDNQKCCDAQLGGVQQLLNDVLALA